MLFHVFRLPAFLTAHAPRIRFVFAATVLPLRGSLTLAKWAATLDRVSGERVTIVGSGRLHAEFDALGIGFDARGDRTDEHLRVHESVRPQDPPSFDGRYTNFPPLVVEPDACSRHTFRSGSEAADRGLSGLSSNSGRLGPLTGIFLEKAAADARIKNVHRHHDDRQWIRRQRGHHIRAQDLADAADSIGRAGAQGAPTSACLRAGRTRTNTSTR